MNRFTLTVAPNLATGHIVAPKWCPYKRSIMSNSQTVHASLCPLCKICDFVPESAVLDVPVTKDERKAFEKYLTEINVKASTSIVGQQTYLGSRKKLPLGIFIGPILFEEMIEYVFLENKERGQKVRAHIIITEDPLCYMLGVPVYLSRKLTKSYIQVVGEVEWKT